jgi:hypothetical protein
MTKLIDRGTYPKINECRLSLNEPVRPEIILKSKASKYKNQKWIHSNDGFSIFVVVHDDEIHVTIWDTERRKQVISSYTETETIVEKF